MDPAGRNAGLNAGRRHADHAGCWRYRHGPNANYAVDLNVPPKDGEFVLVKPIIVSAALKRTLHTGDLLEFGVFLAGDQGDVNLGSSSYYADALDYQVGQGDAKP